MVKDKDKKPSYTAMNDEPPRRPRSGSQDILPADPPENQGGGTSPSFEYEPSEEEAPSEPPDNQGGSGY